MAKNFKRNDNEGSEHKERKSDSSAKRVKKGDKPTFNRFRDDSRPSDFGNSESKPARKFAGKPARKSAPAAKEKRSEQSKPSAKKSYSSFKKGKPAAKKELNPFDLDEQDFQYENFDEQEDASPVRKERRPAADFKGKRRSSSSSSSSKRSENNDGSIRLNKYIANAGICSRREADELISTGVVQVNGKTITEMGYKVKPTDVIKYGGQTLKKERLVYLLLNKPKDYITTVDDPEKRRTVLELVQGACKERIYPVGRLDRATTGLLLFTNDGELTKKLTHPRYGVRKIYHVELDKPLKPADLDKISVGIELEDGPIQVDEITYVGNGSNKKEVGVELHSGRNRVVRRIFETLGYNVRKLDRVMFGPLTKKDMPRGRWRFLTDAEVGMLKMVSTAKE